MRTLEHADGLYNVRPTRLPIKELFLTPVVGFKLAAKSELSQQSVTAAAIAAAKHNGTLPEVWIPPGELRDQRELLRLRIFLVRLHTRR